MIEYLHSCDVIVFRFMNSTIANPLFDILMPFLTDLNKQRVVVVLAFVILLWMIIRGTRSARLTALLLIGTILVSDQINSSVVKYWMMRPRPCQSLNDIHLLVSCGSGFSFPSSHAVNHFAGAAIIAFFYPRLKWWFFGFAALVAFSRISVGVHYPTDVISGSILGLFIGGLILYFFLGFESLWFAWKQRKHRQANS